MRLHWKNSKNNEIQSTEETELTYTCPDEKNERNHVCHLLNVSDTALEQDEKANEFVIRTGWEEAVHGWGRTSPMACIWPRKKLKKVKVGENTGSCLLCVSLSQGSSETNPQSLASKLESGAPEEAGSEKGQGSHSQTQRLPQGPTTASKEISKIWFPSYSQRDKKSLQIKEFIWCMEEWATPETVRGKDPSPDRGPPNSDFLTSKALLVLPPLKVPAPNSLDVLGKKSKNVLLQPEEKVLSRGKDEFVACAYGLKTVDWNDERRPTELAKHLTGNCTQPFTLPGARRSQMANPEQCCLHWPLLPDRNLLCPPSPNYVPGLTTLRLSQKRSAKPQSQIPSQEAETSYEHPKVRSQGGQAGKQAPNIADQCVPKTSLSL